MRDKFGAVGRGDLLYDLDAFEQVSGLLLGRRRRLAALDDVFRPAHRRVDGEDLATMSRPNNMRIAAKCCFTVGFDAARNVTAG